MKKIRLMTKVYDRTTKEFVCKWVTFPISDELAEKIQNEFAQCDFSEIKVYGFGAGENNNCKLPGFRTPLCSQKRFFIEPQFHIVDETGKEYAGLRGF